MIKAGCDIVYLPRFRKILTRTPSMRGRLFLPHEEKNANLETLAGIFAAKEALIKALGSTPGRWHDIQILHENSGKPVLKYLHHQKIVKAQDVSISHDGDYAMAMVVIQC